MARASQRMAKDEQLAVSGEGAGEKGAQKAVVAEPGGGAPDPQNTNNAAHVEGKLALFDRLGGEQGITARLLAAYRTLGCSRDRFTFSRA